MTTEQRKQSDIMNCNGEEKEDTYLIEGDVVYLHNWGNMKEIIGIAILYWDSEYHAWDYHMIAGIYVEDRYDKWRQTPIRIGKITNFKDLENLSYIDEYTTISYEKGFEFPKDGWFEFLKEQEKQAELDYELERKKEYLKQLTLQKNKIQEELISVQKMINDSNEEIKNIKNGKGK